MTELSGILDRVTYHAVYDDSIASALRYAQAAGMRGVQVAAECPHLSPSRVDAAGRREIAHLVRANGLWLSLHAPDDLSLYTIEPAMVDGMFRLFQELIDFAETCRARIITLHPGLAVTFPVEDRSLLRPPIDTDLFEQALRDNVERLCDMARGRVTLCVENCLMDEPTRHLLQPYVNSGDLALCWDIAKSHNADGTVRQEQVDYFQRNIHRIRQVHLHDLREGKGHRAMGAGCIRWMDFLPRLAEASVSEFVLEIRPRDAASDSFLALQKMLQSPATSND